ncbi:carboxymuconolactone decarboxylase family protein [Streptomyces bambusae]|uniref:carboxymuconolactone decarboxylase family protein n=1 Tax=Streptomyces bambusae TaxID=1550616 RepID=UPI001CFF672F|nr:carboxymuconolactone decarboxylase family protein [Streptomyces bambusae]MCB5169983.1 carboxymuconolactone decarboxylase family protein [Streptomyces bambusae]
MTHGTNGTNATSGTDPAARATEQPARLNWAKYAPEVYRAMLALEAAAKKPLDPSLTELVKIRASQLNRCAFCLDMHTVDALAHGETAQRIVQLSAWEESQHFYTPRELAALELTDAVTVLTDGSVPDEVFAKAAAHFDERELSHLLAVIATINAWNRFGVSCRLVPGHYTAGMYA